MGYLGRDIAVSEIDAKSLLVATCDSCGGIGEKQLDSVSVPAELVGRLTARVAMLELVAVGATPRLLTVAICSEPEPTGTKILAGIETELRTAGFDGLPRIVSTEKNITVRQTGLGIGVAGICPLSDLKVNRSQRGDIVYCLGLPKVGGGEIERADDPQIVQIEPLMRLVRCASIHDVLPIGSSGILQETNRLSKRVNCRFQQNGHSIDVQKSAGPSTCAVFTCGGKLPESLSTAIPVTEIGRFLSR